MNNISDYLYRELRQIPFNIYDLISKYIESNNDTKVAFVGGYIRDLLITKFHKKAFFKPKDIDIVIEGSSISLAKFIKKNILNFENYKSESFENTINYENLVNEVINVSDNNSFDLIETFAYEILNSLRKYNNISKATVTIHKPNSPLKELVEDISVTASEEF